MTVNFSPGATDAGSAMGHIPNRQIILGEVYGGITAFSASPIIFPCAGYAMPFTVWVRPVIGDSVEVYYSLDGVNYDIWSAGTVSDHTQSTWELIDYPIVSLKFLVVSGTGTSSTFGITV